MKQLLLHCALRGLILPVCFACGLLCLHGQGVTDPGPLTVLRTGGGVPLATHTQALVTPLNLQSPRIEMVFGFSTDESLAPGVLFDSMTLTLQSAVGTAIYATVDTSGLYLAPASPGTLPIEAGSYAVQPVDFPAITPAPGLRHAWFFTAYLPNEFIDRPFQLYLDLFDNQDAVPSLAFINQAVVVPEPSAVFMLLGLVSLGLFGRLVRRS